MIDLSLLLNSVKPKERTDQYVVLAALYAERAHVSPVTVKDINGPLKLHLGKKVPSNLSASLRAYAGLVSPHGGTPLRWSLTEKGVQKLRTLSGINLSVESTSGSFDYDIGIICALNHPELSAVMCSFGGTEKWKEISDPRYTHVCRETEFETELGARLKAVATTSTSMGLTAAAIATTQMVIRFRPKLIIMIGIAAGTRSGGKEFGDVLVADPSVDYNSGKVVASEGIREFQPDPYPIGLNPRLRSVLQKYHGSHVVFEDIRKQWKGKLPAKLNRLHLGPVGAADQVIDDESRIWEIQKNWRKLIGVEMETYGVYRAVHEAPEPRPRFASFKAVCDFAAAKTDSWQDYAAFVAAEFSFQFLRREWSNLWPQAASTKEEKS